eukprot:COSAG01_NODE_4839_length_4694_cov_16.413058_5_plen_361_part_00
MEGTGSSPLGQTPKGRGAQRPRVPTSARPGTPEVPTSPRPSRTSSVSSVSSDSSSGSPLVPTRSTKVVANQKQMRADNAASAAAAALPAHHEESHEPLDRSQSVETYRTCIDRPYVQQELGWALQFKKPIIVMYEADPKMPGCFDFGVATRRYQTQDLLPSGEGKWSFLFKIDAVPFRRMKNEDTAMVTSVLERAEAAAVQAQAAQAPATKSQPLNKAGKPGKPGWDFFLSHGQRDGGDQMKTLAMLLKQKGRTTWLDVTMVNKSVEAMKEGVKHSRYFLIFLTKDPQATAEATAAAAAPPAAGAKEPEPETDHSAAMQPLTLPGELGLLSQQRKDGTLTEAEFTAAKASVISAHKSAHK